MNVPSLLGVISKVLTLPGMTSILKSQSMTQKEWMTSGEVSSNLIFSSTGTHSVGGTPGVPTSYTSSSR